MKIWAKPYQRRDGQVMMYINNDRRVNVAVSERGNLSSKFTQGQKKLWEEAMNVFREKSKVINFDIDKFETFAKENKGKKSFKNECNLYASLDYLGYLVTADDGKIFGEPVGGDCIVWMQKIDDDWRYIELDDLHNR